MADTPIDVERVLERLERIHTLTAKLAKSRDVAEQQELAEQIHREIVSAKAALTVQSRPT